MWRFGTRFTTWGMTACLWASSASPWRRRRGRLMHAVLAKRTETHVNPHRRSSPRCTRCLSHQSGLVIWCNYLITNVPEVWDFILYSMRHVMFNVPVKHRCQRRRASRIAASLSRRDPTWVVIMNSSALAGWPWKTTVGIRVWISLLVVVSWSEALMQFIQFYSVHFVKPNITNYKCASEGFTICTVNPNKLPELKKFEAIYCLKFFELMNFLI